MFEIFGSGIRVLTAEPLPRTARLNPEYVFESICIESDMVNITIGSEKFFFIAAFGNPKKCTSQRLCLEGSVLCLCVVLCRAEPM